MFSTEKNVASFVSNTREQKYNPILCFVWDVEKSSGMFMVQVYMKVTLFCVKNASLNLNLAKNKLA